MVLCKRSLRLLGLGVFFLLCGSVSFCWSLTTEEKNNIAITWITQANYSAGLDDELLKAMSDAGCQHIFMGFESLDPEELKSMNKTMNSPEQYAKAVKNVRRIDVEYDDFLEKYGKKFGLPSK